MMRLSPAISENTLWARPGRIVALDHSLCAAPFIPAVLVTTRRPRLPEWGRWGAGGRAIYLQDSGLRR